LDNFVSEISSLDSDENDKLFKKIDDINLEENEPDLTDLVKSKKALNKIIND